MPFASKLFKLRHMVSYRLNTPDVIHETVDGEALIIHTPSGVYFSLQGTGEHVWNAVLAGHSLAEIAAAYADGTDVNPPEVITALECFVENLVREQLLVPSDESGEYSTLPSAPHPFSTPTVQKFTDMQELLLVDPIHEVDPLAGWPHRGGE